MYIELTIDRNAPAKYSFQRKDESGTNIGTPDEFTMADYDMDRKSFSSHLTINYAGVPSYEFPPLAAYPLHRMIIITAPGL